MIPYFEYILKQKCTHVCSLLNSDQFVEFCKKRGVACSKKTLEQLEELKIFNPIYKVKQRKYKAKSKNTEDGKGYQILGPLEPNEIWEGDIKDEYLRFNYHRSDYREWIDSGDLWDPLNSEFVPWDNFRDKLGRTFADGFYSRFQCYEFWFKIKSLRIDLCLESIFLGRTDLQKIDQIAREMVEIDQKHYFRYDIPIICQILSDRYFPLTQSNQRFFSVSGPYDWDWHDFCSNWDASEISKSIQLSSSDIRKAWEMMVMDSKSCDPMEEWYDLVKFINPEKRGKLKDSALMARLIYDMEYMLRLFYKDLTGEFLPTPSGPITYKFIPGHEKESNQLIIEELENIINEFHLNPRPSIILVIEGDSEATIFPEYTYKYFSSSYDHLGIQPYLLKGVGNFTGQKRYDPFGALEKFIDYHHLNGTLVFIILDNEGRAKTIKNRLVHRRSSDGTRKLTRPEYIHIWKSNIEFDNFNNDEIASAMNTITGNAHYFNTKLIQQAREIFGEPKTIGINEIYLNITGHDLNKIELLRCLMEKIDISAFYKRKNVPPIVTIMDTILHLALQNRQMFGKEYKGILLNRGFFGELISK